MNMSDVFILIVPFMFFVAKWLFSRTERCLPEKQREALKDFADIAVKCVEQKFGDLSNTQKEQAAIEIVVRLFVHSRLPIPDLQIITVVIEALVWEMNN